MPEFQLTSFNGGLANRIRPHLLDPQYATTVVDADIADGSLRSFNDIGGIATHEYFTKQNRNGTRSLVKWSGKYYWSDNDTGELGSDNGYIGIEPPTSVASPRAQERGNRFRGVYQYLFTFETREGFESAYSTLGSLSLRASINTGIEERTLIPLTDIEEFSPQHYKHYKRRGYEEGDSVNYEGRTYQAISAIYGETADGSGSFPRYTSLGAWQYPSRDNGKYWEDITGVSISIAGTQSILLSDIPQPATGSPATFINIYRTIADGGTFFYVDRVNVGNSTYVDTTDDVKASLNRALNLSALDFPPLYKETGDEEWTKVGGRYLTVEDGTFYLAYEDRVYLSSQDNPHGWDPARYLEFEDTVTGIAAEDRGVLVFTKNRTYHVTGTTLADIVRRWVPNYQGCPNWRTISYLFDMPIWMSYDGLTKFGYEPNISVERITVLSEKAHTFPTNITFAVVANDTYYAFRDDGKVTCVDFRRDGVIYERNIDADSAVYDEESDRLLVEKSGVISIVGAGDPLEYVYISPDLNFESPVPKRLRSIYINAAADVEVSAYVDGALRFTGTTAGSKDRRLYFAPGLVGDYFRLGFKSKGEIKRVSIDYTNMQKQR